MASDARDPVLQAELVRLATLYEAQAALLEAGKGQASDPCEASSYSVGGYYDGQHGRV